MNLRDRVRRWLGLGEMLMGVDVAAHNRDESCVVLISKLDRGAVRIIDLRFDSLQELRRFVDEMQVRYGIHNNDITYDLPPGMRL